MVGSGGPYPPTCPLPACLLTACMHLHGTYACTYTCNMHIHHAHARAHMHFHMDSPESVTTPDLPWGDRHTWRDGTPHPRPYDWGEKYDDCRPWSGQHSRPAVHSRLSGNSRPSVFLQRLSQAPAADRSIDTRQSGNTSVPFHRPLILTISAYVLLTFRLTIMHTHHSPLTTHHSHVQAAVQREHNGRV